MIGIISLESLTMDSHQYNPPYPTSNEINPLESLEELQRSRKRFLNNGESSAPLHVDTNLHYEATQILHTGPPLPQRPPQHIIDHHIPLNGPNLYQGESSHDTPEHPLLPQTMSQSRLQGPRALPSKFSNSNLSSVISGESPNAIPLPSQLYQAPYPMHSPIGSTSRYDQFASSPIDGKDNYFSRHSSASDAIIGPQTTKSQSSPFFLRSPDAQHVPIATESNMTYDSPISALPDVPQVPNAIYSSPTIVERKGQSQSNSPSPTKGGFYGPRLRPSRTSLIISSPSASPSKTYYDHRTSWRSEYSLNVLDTDDEDESDPFNDIHELPSQTSNESSNIENSLTKVESVMLPNVQTRSPDEKVSEKELPPVPITLELPTLPFSARILKEYHYKKCSNVALLSEIFQWSIILTEDWSDGLLITSHEYRASLKLLIAHKTLNIRPFVLEKHIDSIMSSFEKQHAIYVDENDTIHFLSNVSVRGVLPTLTPCYSYVHRKVPVSPHCCYSSRCPLTISKPPVPHAPPAESLDGNIGEWTSYWNFTQQDLNELDEDVIKRQSHIFELIRQQQSIIKLGEIQVKVYGHSFKNTRPQLLPDVSKFYNDTFNSVKPLIELHRKHLLEPLIHKLNVQGKFISGIGEIFINWSKLSTVQYLKYTEQMASVRELIKYEKSKGSRFSQWLLEVDANPVVVNSSLDHNRIFFSGFTGHTQSLALVLSSIFKKTKESDEDHHMLKLAIAAVDQLNRKIDETQGVALETRELRILSRQLSWRNTLLETDLKLSEPVRKIVKRDLVMRKDKWTTTSNLMILLDNYLLITEQQRDHHIKIVEKPIPVEFLQVETKDILQTVIAAPENQVEGETYQFIIRHTGQNLSYRLFTDTVQERDSWIRSFNKVKQKDGKTKNVDAYQISVLSDQFQYPDGHQPQKLPICVPGSNIDLVLKDFQQAVEEQFSELGISRPVMVSEVLSGTTITFQNESYHLLGLNYGLFMTPVNNPKGWKRVLEMPKITQIDQLHELLVLVSDKGLFYFSLVSLLLNYYGMNPDGIIVGERLSKHGVAWFKIGTYYNTTLLFVLKSPIQSSIGGPKFKVLTPIFNRLGKFQNFELYKKFQISNDCHDISIFNSMFVLHTSKGFEILSFQVLNESQFLPKFIETAKKPRTEIELIKKNLNLGHCKPLKMVKVPHRPQFYLIYDTFAMVIDTIGQLISDKFIFPFKFKCSWVSIQDEYLICVGVDIVEIFDLRYDEALGFLRCDPVQIITGKDIKLIDEKHSKICMAHPVIPGRQLVLGLTRV